MLNPTAPVAEPAPRAAERPRPAAKPDAATTGRMTVAGRVLDPDGKPVEGAVVDLVAQAPLALGRRQRRDRPVHLLGQGESDADGRFRLDAPRTASIRVFEVHRAGRRARLRPGLGRAEPRRRAARGRDPAPARADRPRPAGRRDRPAGRGRRGPRPGRRAAERQGRPTTGVCLWANPPEGIRAWPRPVTTDDQGRFTLPGIGRGAERQPAASATSATPGKTCTSIRPRRRPQGDHPRARAGPDHRGPRPGRRHRPAHPQRRRLGRGPGQERARPRHLHRQVPRRRPGTVRHEPDRRRELHRRRLPDRRRALPDPAGRVQVDQGGGQGDPRHQGPPRRADPRQGDRGGDRSAPARVEHPVHPGPGRRRRALGLAGHRGQPGRRLVPDRRPARQGTPARLRPDRRLRPRRDRLQQALQRIGPAGRATTPTPSSPTRSRPATRRTRSPRRCGRA